MVDGYIPSLDRVMQKEREFVDRGMVDDHDYLAGGYGREWIFGALCHGFRSYFHQLIGDIPRSISHQCAFFVAQFAKCTIPDLRQEFEQNRRHYDNRQLIVTYEEDSCVHEDRCMRELLRAVDFEEKKMTEYQDYPVVKRGIEELLEATVIEPFISPELIAQKNLLALGITTPFQDSVF